MRFSCILFLQVLANGSVSHRISSCIYFLVLRFFLYPAEEIKEFVILPALQLWIVLWTVFLDEFGVYLSSERSPVT